MRLGESSPSNSPVIQPQTNSTGDGGKQCVPPSSSGLVNTAPSDTRTFAQLLEDTLGRAPFELKRRLSRLRRRTVTRARVQSQEAGEGHTVDMATFTYRPGCSWSPRHMAECIKRYREQARRDGVPFRYEWVAELQTRRMAALVNNDDWSMDDAACQCMHYHALFWAPCGYSWPKPDTRGWWPHGMTQVEAAQHPVSYLAKYASKASNGFKMPKGCRLSGGGGLSFAGRREVAWWMLPRYVREAFPICGQVIRREPGGGWYNWDEGVFLEAADVW